MSVQIILAIVCSYSFQTTGDVQQDGVAPSSAAEARSASQNLLITGGERTVGQNQDSQVAVVGSIGQPAKDRLLSQCSAAEEKPALKPAAGEGTNSTPKTSKGRLMSNVVENIASQGAKSSSKQRHQDAEQDQ